MPEPLIEFDEFGEMTGVTRAPRNIAHRIIEEFMLAANEAVAEHLEKRGRAVDLPHPRAARSEARDGVRGGGGAFRLLAGRRRDPGEEVRRTRKAARWPQGAEGDGAAGATIKISSRNYQKLVAKIEGKPEERILSYLMLRSLEAGAVQRRRTRATSRWRRPAIRISLRPSGAIRT